MTAHPTKSIGPTSPTGPAVPQLLITTTTHSPNRLAGHGPSFARRVWRATAAACVIPLLLSTLGACTGSPDDPSEKDRSDPPTSSADDTAAAWAEMRNLVDRPPVALRAPAGLRPVAGFTREDVQALTARALEVLRRSSDPRLSMMDADAAVSRVYAGQYAATTFEFTQEAIDLMAGFDWQWFAASRFPTAPGPPDKPRVLKVTAAVSSGKDTTDDGTTAKFLIVTLQAHISQTVNTERYGRVPIVVRRTVRASGFRPRGGPDWWPSVTSRTVPFGNKACGLLRGAVLEPITDATDLRKDVQRLRNSLGSARLIPDRATADTRPEKLREFVRQECN